MWVSVGKVSVGKVTYQVSAVLNDYISALSLVRQRQRIPMDCLAVGVFLSSISILLPNPTPPHLPIPSPPSPPSLLPSLPPSPLSSPSADSWPMAFDDSKAQHDWGWKAEYDLRALVEEMVRNIDPKRVAETTVP